jgi:hypothetical protein
MPERRKLKRVHLIFYLRVFAGDDRTLLGQLVDITKEGLMLISEKPIEPDRDFDLTIDLPQEINGSKVLQFRARSRWSKPDVNPSFYNTGFQLEDVDEEYVKIIRNLISRFRFKD